MIKPTDSLSAYDLFLQARQMNCTYGSGEMDYEQERLLLRTIELDPQFAAAYGILADNCSIQFLKTGDQKILDKKEVVPRGGIEPPTP